ncbi:substrate-binding periplasmic protein [Shewanella cyperi]|uniref:substrate-binding periplasmic protein n=1 Tax=Shewanella cyperi TaxID=2814292 RepID=UPI001A93F141|nr:transporter substrate-binding domain-containing protein [Shewanella cyperi]QSX40449.1 transporter substrate-binding domain-containing protein [Shewanella cyperi]
MKKIHLIACLGLAMASLTAHGCELVMGYRTSERMPYIHEAPDNSGLYFELYQLAAQRLGCQLTVVREPKNRIMHGLTKGDIDFYPGLGFNEERQKIVHFIANGLKERYVGIGREDAPSITRLDDLVRHNMVLLRSLGGFDLGGLPPKLNIRQLMDMDIAKALTLLQERKGDFFVYDEANLRYFLKQHPQPGLRLQTQCCEAPHPMYLGFSRKSKHITEEANPDFDPTKPLAPENVPIRIQADSLAARFQTLLLQMEQEGLIEALGYHWFGSSPETAPPKESPASGAS